MRLRKAVADVLRALADRLHPELPPVVIVGHAGFSADYFGAPITVYGNHAEKLREELLTQVRAEAMVSPILDPENLRIRDYGV